MFRFEFSLANDAGVLTSSSGVWESSDVIGATGDMFLLFHRVLVFFGAAADGDVHAAFGGLGKSRHGERYTEDDDLAIRDLRDRGHSFVQIARLLGRTPAAVEKRHSRMSIT